MRSTSSSAPTTVLALAVLALVLGLLATPADAAFPGPDGELFLTRDVDGNGATAPTVLAATPGGAEREVAPEGTGFGPEVSPDGRELLVRTRADALVRLSIAGGPTREVVPAGRATSTYAWSPDGDEVLYLDGQTGFSVVGIDGGEPRPLNPATSAGLHDIVWAVDGFAYQAEGRRIVRFDPASGATTEIAVPGVQILEDFGLDAAPDGSQLAVACYVETDPEDDPSICLLGLDGSLGQVISPDERFQRDPLFSPDGTRVAFSMSRADFSGDDLFSTDVSGGDLQQIVTDGRPTSWGRTPTTPPAPLEEPPPPPTNAALACGGVDGDPTTTERADFTDPILHAVAISQARFGCDGSPLPDAVVLSRDDAFADSLVGAALTGDAPLLFTRTDTLPDATATEIGRLLDDGDTVYLLGGTAAISTDVEDLLTAFEVRRLAGPSRVETSVEVAREVAATNGTGAVLAIARAGGPADNPTAAWADSVSGGAWTAAEAVPTVVTDTTGLHPAVQTYLDQTDVTSTILFGGTAALSAAIEAAVPDPTRIAGASRADTARLIATQLIGNPDDGDRTAIAINGYRPDGWQFGLPAAGLAADLGASIALVTDPLPPETVAQLCDPATIDVLLTGGRGVITPTTADQIDATGACGSR